MKPNGPAIKGGCVTRRKHRAASWYFRQEFITVQGGYGVLFAVMAEIILRTGAVAVQCCFGEGISPRAGFLFWALVQCRVTRLGRRKKFVMVQDYYCEQGAYPGAAYITNLS